MAAEAQHGRERIIEQATAWLVVNRSSGAAAASDDFIAWLRASPVHVKEYLGVASIAHDLQQSVCDELGSLEELIARARVDRNDPFTAPRALTQPRALPLRRWAALAACLAVAGVMGFLSYSAWYHLRHEGSTHTAAVPIQLATRHGEQLRASLPDKSVVHLNTDSALEVSYSPTQRLVVLKSGQASFEVAHDPRREFHVRANSAEVIAVGTAFEVHLVNDATVVTVTEGKVMVGRSTPRQTGASAPATAAAELVAVRANEQVTVTESSWPPTPVAVDAERETAWLRHQIVFENATLEHVAAEMNRYSAVPIEIAPSLKDIQISGVFSTAAPDSLLIFLRSLDGVMVEVTPARIMVSAKHRAGDSVR